MTRAPFEHLGPTLLRLGDAYRAGVLTPEAYNQAYSEFLFACGWSKPALRISEILA